MRYFAQFLLASIAFCLACLPLPLFVALGRGLGGILYRLKFRHGILRENIRRAFPDWPDRKVQELEKENYAHYGQLFIEFLRSFWRFGAFLEKHCTVEGEENLHRAFREGKGVFVMTAHLGNWEILPSHGSHVLKVPVNMVTKRLKPAWFHEIIEETRAKVGTKMFYEPKTMQKIIHALRNNEIVGFAMDQFAGSPVGARVPFFGIPVGTNTVQAVLAHRIGAAVIPGFALRKPGGGFHVVFEAPLPVSKFETAESGYASTREKEIIQDTALYTLLIERWVRKYPEQWLWIHRRWKGDLSPLAPSLIGEMMKPDPKP